MTYEQLIRQFRMEAQLSYRESDRRDPQETWSWVRYREHKKVIRARQAVKDTVKGIEGL